ncbi:hypothetical protein ACQP00_45750 [Dactylosporangium sp. CS-047395]|uniref:hypothetical protein n=1 Tax=Dactylosporangium sp. CS-047395 TaxID=3239936 RepID=UPI003D9482FF
MPANARLRENQTKTLTILMSEGRALTNKELKELGGGELKSSGGLVELGLVEVGRAGRSLTFAITASGRRQLEQPEPSKPQLPPYDRSLPKLSPNQVFALLVLMSEARPMDNTELRDFAGFSLTGADNKKLEALGLVETDRAHSPFSHELTEKGWGLVRRLHLLEPPKESKSAVRTLLTLLGNVGRSLEQLQMGYGEFFRRQDVPVGESVVENVDAESQVRKAYAALAGRPGEWVGLADLRDELPGLARSEVDAVLMALLRQDGVRIIPVANTKGLTARDRAAAIDIGGEDNHVLSIGRP